MTDNDYNEWNSRAIATRGFQIDPIFMNPTGDSAELDKMRRKAVIDTVALHVLHHKTRLSMVLEDDVIKQVKIFFLRELEASDKLLVEAEKLKSRHAYNRYVEFLKKLWDQYEALLYYTAFEGARNISQMAMRSPYPDPEEQRGLLQRLFRGS